MMMILTLLVIPIVSKLNTIIQWDYSSQPLKLILQFEDKDKDQINPIIELDSSDLLLNQTQNNNNLVRYVLEFKNNQTKVIENILINITIEAITIPLLIEKFYYLKNDYRFLETFRKVAKKFQTYDTEDFHTRANLEILKHMMFFQIIFPVMQTSNKLQYLFDRTDYSTLVIYEMNRPISSLALQTIQPWHLNTIKNSTTIYEYDKSYFLVLKVWMYVFFLLLFCAFLQIVKSKLIVLFYLMIWIILQNTMFQNCYYIITAFTIDQTPEAISCAIISILLYICIILISIYSQIRSDKIDIGIMNEEEDKSFIISGFQFFKQGAKWEIKNWFLLEDQKISLSKSQQFFLIYFKEILLVVEAINGSVIITTASYPIVAVSFTLGLNFLIFIIYYGVKPFKKQ